MPDLLPLSDITYEIVSWPPSEAFINNPVETIKETVKFVTAGTPYPMYAGLATAAGARRFMAVVGWESTAAQTAAARGTPGARAAPQAALAPLMADPARPQVEMLHARWPADPAAHLQAPLFEFGVAKAREGTPPAEARATFERAKDAWNEYTAARGVVVPMMLGSIEERPDEWAFAAGYASEEALRALQTDEKMHEMLADLWTTVETSPTFVALTKYA